MRLAIAAALLAGLAQPVVAQETDWAQVRKEWNEPIAPFPILLNVHYVGTAGIAAYLIATSKGHILIDGGMEESAGQIAANIRKLGFRLEDVKIILINHAHWDHSGGLAELKRLTGARLYASAGDKIALEAGHVDYRNDLSDFPPVKIDSVIRDHSLIEIGGMMLRAHLTPGHTKGCTSFTMSLPFAPRNLRVLFACSLTVADQKLVDDAGYPEAAADFRATFAKLRRMKVDVFLAFHPAAFDMEAKRAKLAAGKAYAFVDPGELKRRLDAAETAFEAELAKQRK